MSERHRFKQTASLKERLMTFAQEVHDRATALEPGAERDDLLRRAQHAVTVSNIDEWVNSPGLQPPK